MVDVKQLLSIQNMGIVSTVVLKTQDGGHFRVDRLILMNKSRYFRTLFVTDLYHGATRHEIAIPGVSASSLQAIIHYAQTGEVILTEDNVAQLMVDADQFDVQALVTECSSFLTRHLASTNCIGIYNFAQAYFFQGLASQAYAFIMREFPEVAKNSEEVLDLTPTEVMAILASDELNVRDEGVVWAFVLKYVNYAHEERLAFLPELLGQIRLGLIERRIFQREIERHPLVVKSAACQLLLSKTTKFYNDLQLVSGGYEAKEGTPELARPRLPHEVMLCIGGWTSNGAGNKVESYDTRADRWVEVPEADPLGPRAYHGCVFLEPNIYIFGGFDGIDYFNSCRCFNLITKEWGEKSPMNHRRCYVSTAIMNGVIYALGGYNGRRRLASSEWYDPNTNQWTLLPQMLARRSDASAAILDGKLYMVGGFDGQECLNTCEMFDPEIGEWTEVAKMRYTRSGVACAVYGGYIYAVGGFNGVERLSTVERYDPHINTWAKMPNMYNCRSNFAISVLDDLMFVMGGFNGVTTIPGVECFDRKLNMWLDATKMAFKRSGCCACVVNSIPNLKDYIYPERDEMLKTKRQPNSRSCRIILEHGNENHRGIM